MALNFDDRILGEKVDYYCSSSEDENDGLVIQNDDKLPPSNYTNYSGSCANTGPKGVIEDWRRYKQLEAEQREEQNAERLRLAQKLSLTCRTTEEDDADKEIEQLLNDDEFLEQYRIQCLKAMHRQVEIGAKFGEIFELTKETFLDAIDNEAPDVTILVHVYKKNLTACISLSNSFLCLCKEHPNIKFCQLPISEALLSLNFSLNALPTLLVYKKKDLIGNFVRLSDDLGEEFYATDLEGFLIEHGFLNDEISYKRSIRSVTNHKEDSDNDFDLDT